MKQIIFSTAMSLVTLMAMSQNNLVAHQTSETSSRSFSKISIPEIKSFEKVFASRPDTITIRVFSNSEGEVVKMLKYYSAADILPMHIRTRLSKRYAGYVPTAIIEENDAAGVAYIINIKKGDRWMQVNLSLNGRLSVVNRYKNAL